MLRLDVSSVCLLHIQMCLLNSEFEQLMGLVLLRYWFRKIDICVHNAYLNEVVNGVECHWKHSNNIRNCFARNANLY